MFVSFQSQRHVALKKISFKRIEDGIPITVFREIKALQELQHENVSSSSIVEKNYIIKFK